MVDIRVAEWGADLLGRIPGEALREDLESKVRGADAVRFDFAGVGELSWSFADECFGKLVAGLLNDPSPPTIDFAHTNPEQRARIRSVIQDRRCARA